MLRRLVLVLAASALVLAACSSDGDGDASDPVVTADTTPFETPPTTVPPEVPTELEGTWVVVSAGDDDAPDGITMTISKGPVTGFLGCNEFFGSVAITDGALTFGEISAQEIGCEGVDDFFALTDALVTVDGYVVEGDDVRLTSGDGVVVVLQKTDLVPA